MYLKGRLTELIRRHNHLDKKILEEQKRPSADPIMLNTLKRRKLLIKEEIRHLENT